MNEEVGIRSDLPRAMSGSEVATLLQNVAKEVGCNIEDNPDSKLVPGSVKEVPNTHNLKFEVLLKSGFLNNRYADIRCNFSSQESHDHITFFAYTKTKSTTLRKGILISLLVCGIFPGILFYISSDPYEGYTVDSTTSFRYPEIRPHLHKVLERFYKLADEAVPA